MEKYLESIEEQSDECSLNYVPATIHLIAFNYNSMDFLDGFFKSINEQTLDRFDLTIINYTGSNDGSWEKIKSWVPRLSKSGLKLMWWNTMNFPNVDVFYPNFKIVDDKDHQNIIGYHNWPEYSHKALLKENFCGCSPLIKGITFFEADLYDESLMYTSDYDLFLRLALDDKKFKLIEEVIGSHYEGKTPDTILKRYNEEVESIQQLHNPFSYEEEV